MWGLSWGGWRGRAHSIHGQWMRLKHRLVFGVSRHSCHLVQLAGKPKAVEGQHAASFPRVRGQEPCRPPRAPGAIISSAWAMPLRFARWGKAPFPGGGRCLILLLCWFPPSAAAFALLVVLRQPSRSRTGGGRAGSCAQHQAGVFGGCPRVQGCRCFPTPGTGAAGPGSHNNPRPIRRPRTAGRDGPPERGGGGGGAEGRLGDLLHPPALGGRRAPSVPGLGPQLPRLRPPPTPPPPRHQTLTGDSPGQPGAAPAVAGRAGVSAGGGRCPRCPMAARARA